MIKIRQSPVPEVSEMMDIIKNNMVYHFGLIYSVDIASTFVSAADSGRIASSFTVAERRLNKQLENLSKALQNLP